MKPELYLDADSPLQALSIASALARNYPARKLWARRSSSRRGWHFWVEDERYNVGLNIKLRELFGDCRGRIKADKIRKKAGMPTCILFDAKNGKLAEPWRRLSIKEILEDFKVVKG